MTPLMGSRIKNVLPWSQCHCGCGAGSKARKAERRQKRRIEKNEWKREVR